MSQSYFNKEMGIDNIPVNINSIELMERKTYIDIMKCIGIILIVMGHIPITNRFIHD